jgi:hypothetical protein
MGLKTSVKDFHYVAVFIPLLSLGFTGMIWFSMRTNFLAAVVSAAFFSVNFRAMTAKLRDKEFWYIFSVRTNTIYGDFLAYSHFILATSFFYLFFQAISTGFDLLLLTKAFLVLILAYGSGHVGAKGAIL